MKYSQLQLEDLVMENSTECEGKSQVYSSSLKSFIKQHQQVCNKRAAAGENSRQGQFSNCNK